MTRERLSVVVAAEKKIEDRQDGTGQCREELGCKQESSEGYFAVDVVLFFDVTVRMASMHRRSENLLHHPLKRQKEILAWMSK